MKLIQPPPPRRRPGNPNFGQTSPTTPGTQAAAKSEVTVGTKDEAAIPWYATLSRGLAEAKRTGKPILFVSAAPHCAGVSGMW